MGICLGGGFGIGFGIGRIGGWYLVIKGIGCELSVIGLVIFECVGNVCFERIFVGIS